MVSLVCGVDVGCMIVDIVWVGCLWLGLSVIGE